MLNDFLPYRRMEGFSYLHFYLVLEGPWTPPQGEGQGGVKGGVKKGGSDPPPKWGSRFGVFLDPKKWSKMVKKGAGRRGKQKCSFRG